MKEIINISVKFLESCDFLQSKYNFFLNLWGRIKESKIFTAAPSLLIPRTHIVTHNFTLFCSHNPLWNENSQNLKRTTLASFTDFDLLKRDIIYSLIFYTLLFIQDR